MATTESRKKIIVKRRGGQGPEPADEPVHEEPVAEPPQNEGGHRLVLRSNKSSGASAEWADREADGPSNAKLAVPRIRKPKRSVRLAGHEQMAAPELEPEPERGVRTRGSARRRGRRSVPDGAHEAGVHIKRKEPSKAPAIIGFLLLGGCLAGLGLLGMRIVLGPTVGRIGEVTGAVNVIVNGKSTPAEPKMALRTGAQIVCDADDCEVYFAYARGGVVHAVGAASFSVGLTKRNAVQYDNRWVALQKGIIYVDSPLQDKFPMVVSSPYADASFWSAKLGLTCTNDIVELIVTEGAAKFTRKEGALSIDVPKGHYVTVAPGVPFVARAITGETNIKKISVIDAATEAPLPGFEEAPTEGVVDFGKITSLLAMRADTDPASVGSVSFQYKREEGGSKETVVVNDPPYVFRGKQGAGFGSGWRPIDGTYKFVVRSYSLREGKGKPSAPRVIILRVTGSK